MSNTAHLPDRTTAKALAKRLRATLESEGNFISHSEALELVAKQHGFRDWNTMSAAQSSSTQSSLAVGRSVSGRYLGHAFQARILGLEAYNHGARHKVTLDLDEAIDVVASAHFSGLRKRISGVIGRDGKTWEKTANGQPILQLDL
jgi:hypothetical protein